MATINKDVTQTVIAKLKILGLAMALLCVFNSCKKKKEAVVAPVQTLKVLSYNVYEGFSGDPVKIAGFKKWIDTLKPDVIALMEMKDFTKAGLQTFAVSMGFSYTLMWHEAGLPVALISKYPITNIKTVPSDLHLIEATVLDYHFFVVHLSALTYDIRKSEMQLILQRTRAITKTEKILMMGDFNNMSPQDATYYDNNPTKMELVRQSEINNPGVKILNNGKIDYATIQNVIDDGFYDCWKMFRSSYEKSAPTKMRTHGNFTRIDYIWMNQTLVKNYKDSYMIKDAYTDYMSDHYPMVLILNR